MANNLIDFRYMNTTKKNCIICDSEFFPLKAEVKRGKGKVCSKGCRYKHQGNVMRGRKMKEVTKCKLSASLSGRVRSDQHCIRISEALTGKVAKEDNPNWKGGNYVSQGRRYRRAPDHPFSHHNGYILNSRYVAEEALGRQLTPSEQIHHINLDKLDDSPNNLYLFNSAAEHSRYHNLAKVAKVTPITESNLSSF